MCIAKKSESKNMSLLGELKNPNLSVDALTIATGV
jgi:hypothetical protein